MKKRKLPFQRLALLRQQLLFLCEDAIIYLCDLRSLLGLIMGICLSSLWWAAFALDESCEPSYPRLSLFKGKAWAFFEVRALNRAWYDMIDNEKEQGVRLLRDAAVEAVSPGTGSGPGSSATSYLAWTAPLFGWGARNAG